MHHRHQIVMMIKMGNKNLKRIMTDLAAGHISKKEADMLIKGLKKQPRDLKQESKGKNTRKRKLNKTGGK